MQPFKALMCASVLWMSFVTVKAQNLDLLGQVPYPVELRDLWGYADGGGNEYALVGLETGVSIVDVTDPNNPAELFQTTGPSSSHRDLDVWQDHAYVTNEEEDGLLIIDLSDLPNSINTWRWDTLGFTTAHNVFIDENGFAYIVGADYGNGGALIVDLSNPAVPQLVGIYDEHYIHDAYVRGDTMWASEVYQGHFAVIDVSDKSNPQVLATRTTPHNFTHNTWLSDDGNYLFTTDEVASGYIASYDVSDVNNIAHLGQYRSSPGSDVIPHNTHYLNGFLITSYYRDGIIINDVQHPDNIIETGRYDTSPLEGDGFNGCWGVYPYLPSGIVLASDMEEGLFVLDPTYSRAGYLEGMVTDSANGNPLQNVSVQISGSSAVTQTDLSGGYKTGIADSGSFRVTFAKPGFYDKTIDDVPITNDSLTYLDVELAQRPIISVSGKVEGAASGNGIPSAPVRIHNEDTSFSGTADNNGNYTVHPVYSDSFNVIAGKWGYRTDAIGKQLLTGSNNAFTIQLEAGIYDDFIFDFGWEGATDNSQTPWQRNAPNGNTFGSDTVTPYSDVENDFGDQCYFTSVDTGITTLSSPLFSLEGEDIATIRFYQWFFNFGDPDSMTVYLSNQFDTVQVKVITMDVYPPEWRLEELVLEDGTPISFSNSMRLHFRAANNDWITYAAVDKVEIDEARVLTNISHPDELQTGLHAYPNPFGDMLEVQYHLPASISPGQADIRIYNLQGQLIERQPLKIARGQLNFNTSGLAAGTYLLTITDTQRPIRTLKIMHTE